MLLDVTQPIYSNMPKASTLPDVDVKSLLRRSQGDALDTSQISIPSHAGTHIDAPSHLVLGGDTIDVFPLERFIGPGVVVSVRREPGDLITVDDITGGGLPVQSGDMLFIDTDWASRFGSADYHDHPSLDPGLAEWLVEAGVSLVGVDMVTPDLPHWRRPTDFSFPVHTKLLGEGVLIAENLGSLRAAAGHRVTAYALPLRIRGGDAGHVRLVLDVPDVGPEAGIN